MGRRGHIQQFFTDQRFTIIRNFDLKLRLSLRGLKMVSQRTCSDSLSYFLSAFNQVLLGYTLFAIVASVSMEGLSSNPSGVETLVDEDYNFEIKTAMERTKNHAAFMMGIVALTFAAVMFLALEWFVLKYKNANRTAWDVYVFQSSKHKFVYK